MKHVEIEAFLDGKKRGQIVFDVRTPAEFAKGHIPGAKNLPLFLDEERVVVGTLYKQEGRHRAILEGLDYVGPRMRELIETVQREVGPPGSSVMVHCWRGGMRSASVAWLLEMYGFEVSVLTGGYKSFRRWVVGGLEDPPPMRVVGGATGVGKTEILWELERLGESVLDLEGLANHRGSAFGGLLLEEQPTQEHFENLLGVALARARGMAGPVWIEDESRMIGHRHLSNAVMASIHGSPTYVVAAPEEARLDRLVEVYGEAAREQLVASFERIRKSLGGLRTQQAIEAVQAGDLRRAAALALQYYDKAYARGIGRRAPETVVYLDEEGDPKAVARGLIARCGKDDARDVQGEDV
ncbi:tRNA 2-selenouridine(34) synthase MnmH [Lujinxingia litoralis]|uniref:tRNA 2-selenouridine(34) synthase MnmH n=1 Tax=Lujinxingia litoralis TaxID=2211119 RepID=A0A328CBT3_9DELT|nr:tRNA 2-selenouridine(34) synthase MnmH [Lujinxingia litoralis]RAL25136.1 tRNA 2-selenouridine(34) synthase MnmH [Lujinxingia litoralis]